MKTAIFNEHAKESGLEKLGKGITKYGLAIVLIWIGILKFTVYEAQGIKPLVDHSPFLAWSYDILSVATFSKFLGIIEILSGVLIACRYFSAKASIIGSTMAIITFVITLTFLLTTPGVVQPNYSFPFISPQPGQFLLKDIVLLGAAVWSAGEAVNASKMAS